MKAIIVAAGEGTRMRPLTNDKPKQLVELQGKPLLDHILNSLPEEISALIIVVGYKGDQIRTWYGVTHAGKPITYVEQTERKGTRHALSLCEPYIEKGEKFFYLYADDLHGREGVPVAKCCRYDARWPRVLWGAVQVLVSYRISRGSCSSRSRGSSGAPSL